ncbi:hypothetical protein RvY_18890-2 [Ramazzottius varieornatus]|uniref:MORN repeat-containing protein 5 n=1 Tax=Ramazzottius varieornatus TaxID=947166 RepID=A0A1D1WA61_RAMVA|nr:hypothetical protein RvY_18890-2 [Ramazzottius varieornatus]
MAMYSDKSAVAAVLKNVKLRFADGDTYDGQAWNSVRHGRGMYRWRNGEVFDGYFYYDLMHGAGQYWWSDGRFFSGHFYANRRHGYGLLAFPNGDTVQGLFRDGVLYGPAVQSSKMEQDVGWWLGSHLLQVLMEQHFDVPYLQQVLTLLSPKPAQVGKSSPQLEAGEVGGSADGAVAVRRYQLNGAAVSQPHQAFVALLDMAFDRSLQRTASQYQQVFRNNSPQLRAMQQYVWQMDSSIEEVSRQVEEAFVRGREGNFLPAGLKERQVEQLFRACATGDLRMVHQLILRDKLNVDVCDRNGISPLMTATVNSRLDVMEFLLEFEADMEHETNSGYSVVELAFVMYHCFVEKFNGWNNNDPSVESVLGLPEKVTVTVAASAIAETTDTLVSTKSSPPKSAPAQAAATKTTPGEFRLDQMEQNVKGVMETYHSVQALKDVPINLPPHGFQRTGQQLYHLVSRYGLSMEKPMAENTFFLSWLKHWQHSVKEALLLLLNRGANWRRCIWPQPLLFSAVRGLDADLVQKLVDMGDDVNQRMFKEGFTVTPLLVACGQMGSAAVEVVEVLLKAGADPDVPEINTNPTKVQADKKGAKGKKGSPVPTSGPLDKGRRPIHVVFQRDGADPANEKLLEALIRYDATVDATWNNSSALASAVQLANVTMVDALLRVGCNVNRDLEGGKGNALCVLATLATTEGFLRCNKDAQTIKAVMKMLLASADFTIKIPLAEGPPGSPLDFASHLFAKVGNGRLCCSGSVVGGTLRIAFGCSIASVRSQLASSAGRNFSRLADQHYRSLQGSHPVVCFAPQKANFSRHHFSAVTELVEKIPTAD